MPSLANIPFIKVIALLLCLSILRVDAQQAVPDRFVSTLWGMEEGMPQSSVNYLLQTRDGYLWLATFGGLVRFNGKSFTTFNRSNSPGLRSDRFLHLFEDREGGIWCSTERGIFRFKDQRFTAVAIIDETHNYSPLMFAEDEDGRMWISANGTPYRYNGTSFVEVPVIRDPVRRAAVLAPTGGVWIAHEFSLLKTSGDSVVQVEDFTGTVQNNFQSVAEYPKGSGEIWLATSGEGVLRYRNGTISRYGASDGLPSIYLKYLHVDRNNTLWASGFNGISSFAGDRFVRLKTVSGKIDREINVITRDQEGNYWVGSPSFGLGRLRPAYVTMIRSEQGLKEGKMLSLTRLKDGRFLFGTNCGGIYEWDGHQAVYSSLNRSLVNLCTWSVFEDSRRYLWVGSRVLERYEPGWKRKVLLDSSLGFNGADIFAMTEDGQGRIWIGCMNGLFVYDGSKFRHFGRAEGLLSADVRALFEDREGTLWVGTTNGVHRVVSDSIVPVDLHTGGPADEKNEQPYVRAIYQDEAGAMWFGTYGEGIARLKEGRTSWISTNQGMFDNIVSHLERDEQGYLWMGCNRGIIRIALSELNDVADGIKGSVNYLVLGRNDGMDSPETNGGFQPSVVWNDHGGLLFPTVEGVAVVDTRTIRRNEVPPPVIIERMVVDQQERWFPSETVLSYDSADVEIHYAALSFSDNAKVQYRYRLDGVDTSWVVAGNRNEAYFTNIPPGVWTFTVIASNNDGVWNSAGASVRITVTPPFWRTWWFYILVGLFFAAAGPSVYYYRVTQLKKEKSMQERFARQLIESQEQERQRIAAELHDGIGQQILVIKNRAEMAMRTSSDANRTDEQLREIMHSAVSSIKDIRSISHGLRPVHLEQFGLTEALTSFAEELRETSSIEWSYHIDPVDGLIPKDQEINFYRILQEATNNILKHSQAREASMMVRRVDDLIVVTVWDDGKGFSTEAKSSTAGMGLSGMQERIKSLGGTLEVHSGEMNGTTVRMYIPVNMHG